MKLTEKLRKYWHDLYYYCVSDRGVEFAMTCKDVAEQVDLGVSKKSKSRIRFWLHISICQGCKNYLSTTQVLSDAVKKAILKKESPARIEKLNQELLEKHTQNENS